MAIYRRWKVSALCVAMKTLAEVRAELEADCPWPEDIWPMTDEEHVKAVPDPHLRTAVSGFLMRKGWELCLKRMAQIEDVE